MLNQVPTNNSKQSTHVTIFLSVNLRCQLAVGPLDFRNVYIDINIQNMMDTDLYQRVGETFADYIAF